jgi:hypothetical protein
MSNLGGNPRLLQSRFGSNGNFELVVPSGSAGMFFLWRNNDAANAPWSAPFQFGQNAGRVDAVTMIQSNYGSPGNLELIARTGDRLHFLWRDSGPAFRWNGPFRMVVGSVALHAIQSSEGRFIRVDGANFSENASVKIGFNIFTGGMPNTSQTGEHHDKTDGNGAFSDDIKVNITSVGGAQVSVLDESTGCGPTPPSDPYRMTATETPVVTR